VRRWAEHTGELQLEIEAGSEEGVFAEGFWAMRELLEREAPGARRAMRSIALQARDAEALLADWLGELALLAEQGTPPLRLDSLELRGSVLEAIVECGLSDTPHLVKAATYHRLLLQRDGERWRARVVLDV
jgi:SHS2 domain-containing protein